MSDLPAVRTSTKNALGCDYDATSWTTQTEADQMIEFMALRPRLHLLDVGAGAGWPGLYMAKTSGCDITLIDPSGDSIEKVALRAEEDGLAGAWKSDVGDGSRLPYPDTVFDAVSHSDVLCCLIEKQAVLTECRRVIKGEGMMAFSVISIEDGLSAERQARAIANGPPMMEKGDGYPAMLERADWRLVEHRNLTPEFLTATRRQLATGDGLKEKWLARIEALKDGLLRRELFVVTPGANSA